MTMPDPDAESGRIDWWALLRNVLPHVDLFCPSLDELRFMTRASAKRVSQMYCYGLGQEMLAHGAGCVMLKLGSNGAMLIAGDADRLAKFGRLEVDPSTWADARLHQPAFRVDVAGATGAGDSTIAGLIAGIGEGGKPDQALRTAVAVGSLSVRAHDATSAIPPLPQVRAWLADAQPIAPNDDFLTFDQAHGS